VPESSVAIAVEGLSIRYDALTAVESLSFEVAAGELVALLGPNGAGKTSTVEAIEGYRRPSEGSVRVLGLDPAADRPRLTPRIGVMLQEGGVYTAIRPVEVLKLFASYYDNPVDPDEMLDRVGLGERRRSSWRSLSGGEKQRLSLGLALIGRPEVAFLDEPTAGVDVQGRQVIRTLVRELRDDGVAVLLTTHDLEDAEKLADRVVIIDRGTLVACGTTDELVRHAGSGDLLFGAQPGLDLASLTEAVGATVTETSPGEYQVATAGDPRTVARLTSWLADHDIPVADIRAGRKRLEDVFLRLTGDSEAPE
jgi:ABC-2 type transport system ATP-binding protein